MSWFADLAGKAESLLNNLDEQTGAVLRNNNGVKEAWGPKKKSISRNTKRNTNVPETRSSYSGSPTKFHQPRSAIKQSQDNVRTAQENNRRRSPGRKPAQYNLNNSPKTVVGDFNDNKVMDQYGLRHRRYSLPSDLEILDNDNMAYNMQNCEIENAMLKNELNVMNREVSELLDRLSKTEDELKIVQTKFENSEKLNHMLKEELETLVTQADKIKQQEHEVNSIQSKYIEQNQKLESSVHALEYKNVELEEKIKTLSEELSNKELAQNKLENELRHAQTMISEKQNEIEKSQAECHRLEKDWEAYKLRVKNMLFAKDDEIKSLREGGNSTEDTKMLVGQIESLKEEREDLSQSISRVRQECDDMKQSMSQLEQRYSAAERVVSALRDTLKEERSSRNRAEMQCLTLGKELQSLQIESAETVSNLRSALENKEEELNNLRETASAVPLSDASALNVADYDVIKDIDNEKIHYLTQMLIQKQGKIDTLLADNNILKIQLDKLQIPMAVVPSSDEPLMQALNEIDTTMTIEKETEDSISKHRSDLASLRSKYSHSVVHLQDGDTRIRSRLNYSGSPLSALSLRIGVMIKRFPIFRLLILIYMIGLHLWVLTVLFTNTPEDYVPRPTKL